MSAGRLSSFAPISSPDQMTQSIILDGSDGWQAYVLSRRILNHEEITDIRPVF